MPKNKKAGFFLLLFLLSLLFLPIGSSRQKTENGSTINEPFSSLMLNNLTEQPAVIMIDPGHGGADTGVDKKSITESEVTLDISQKLKTCLEEKAHIVEMTRSRDISLYQLSDISGTVQKRELDARVALINKSDANIFVSIHVNSCPESPGLSGSIVYYNSSMPESRKLSDCIQDQLNKIEPVNFKRDRHDPREADFYLLKNSDIPGVLVETAFITNSRERKLLSKENFRSQIAKAVAEGIEDYFNIK